MFLFTALKLLELIEHIFGDYLIEFEYNNDRIIVFLNRSTDFVTDFR